MNNVLRLLGLTGAAGAAALAGEMSLSHCLLETPVIHLACDGLPTALEGLRILHLSDLHCRMWGKSHRRLLEAACGLDPQLVVMTGDMIDRVEDDFGVIWDLCGQLSRRWPVFFAPGNHEQRLSSANRSLLYEGMEAMGVTVLLNQKQELAFGDGRLTLWGLALSTRYERNYINGKNVDVTLTAADVNELLGKADPGVFHLLLAHNPLFFSAYRRWGANLTLSGHVHGGMVRLPGVGGLLSPERRFFPQYDGGLYGNSQRQMYVSRGLSGGPRFLNHPQLPLLVLHHTEKTEKA
ncbi:metallophosphoesterase [Angelakisella massiliensis]|uniref:metallophosphoesterase n=1 Tax=Angelakisella massiliensis TaxID=1871018 RepID=UPI0023A7ABBE|nr:metallophosphoesterase [Angelakisella massiliensis]